MFMLLVPVIYDKYDRLVKLARAIREDRIHFILSSTGLILLLLISFITTISAFTEPGCKDASKDPSASLGKQFQLELPGWCQTKKAGAVFFWFAFISWGATFFVVIKEWREGKQRGRPRDPPFMNPIEHTHEDSDTSSYYPAGQSTEAARPLSQNQRGGRRAPVAVQRSSYGPLWRRACTLTSTTRCRRTSPPTKHGRIWSLLGSDSKWLPGPSGGHEPDHGLR